MCILFYFIQPLPRLNHNHLAGLVGFCKEKDERLLVYEKMKNGALLDKVSSVLNYWRRRIKIDLDAFGGIELIPNN